jgi:hypothetical protein
MGRAPVHLRAPGEELHGGFLERFRRSSRYTGCGPQEPAPHARSAADAAEEHDEEDAMPNTKIARFSDLLRLIRRGAATTHEVRGGRVVAGTMTALRRVDDWTLVAFNPRYPSPADHR